MAPSACCARPTTGRSASYADAWQATAGARPLDRLLALNIDTYLLDDLLVKTDRMSMAHGLEVRSPFLDTALVEFAVRLAPGAQAPRPFAQAGPQARGRRICCPTRSSPGPSTGFGVPLDRWFRERPGLVHGGDAGAGARTYAGDLNGAELDRMLAEHDARARNHGHALWTLLTLELFLRRHGW